MAKKLTFLDLNIAIFHTKVTQRARGSTWMGLSSSNSLKHVDNDRQGPSIAQLRPSWEIALKVWKKGQI